MESETTANLSNSSADSTISFTYPPSPIGPDFYNAYNIYLYLMIIFGVLGNFVVLAVFIRHRPASSTDWFILFITICDFVSSFINVPVYATFTNGYWRVYGTTLICRLHMFVSQSLVLSSAFLISGLALDRYLKICRQSSSKTRARNACILISILTTIMSSPCFIMYENRAGRCVSIVMDTTLFAYYLMVFTIFVLATIIVVFSYCKVSKEVMRSERNILQHTGNSAITNRTGESDLTKSIRQHKNKTKICCCIPLNRKRRVMPSTVIVSQSGLFRDTLAATTSTEQSMNADLEAPYKDKDRLQVPKQPKLFTYPPPPVTSVSGQIVEHASNNSLTQSVTSSHRVGKNSRLVSLRTTKISFLVCSVFILTWILPWLCFVLVASVPSVKTNISAIKFMIFGRMTYLINGISNPIIYTLLNKTFRKHILEIFCHRRK